MISNTAPESRFTMPAEVSSCKGKRVVIVGDDAGIGCATAKLLAACGAKIFFAARTQEELGETLSAIAQARGDGEGMVVNLKREEDLQRFFQRAERRLGKVDVLVNHLPSGSGHNKDGVPDVCTLLAAQRMEAQGYGHIISINASGEGRSITASLRHQLKRSNIRVTRIEPGLGEGFDPAFGHSSRTKEDIARCVYDSLLQPFGAEVVFLKDQFVGHLL